ncbi:MAG: DUF2800 domain-containing protein [Bilifractor sp.]
MPTPKKHALLSASSSSRWLNCTAAPLFEAQFPAGDPGIYAKAGTLAHEFCETVGRYVFHEYDKSDFQKRWMELKEKDLYDPEMEKTADFYQHYLWGKSMSFQNKPYVTFEKKVDFSDYVPEGFGTCDCIMIGDDTLHITDYKHGKGVPVDAKGNTQMRLYALGALKQYSMLYSIKHVSMAIVQPRISENVAEDKLTADELLAWGSEIKPIAEKAYSGQGEFQEGPWCRFCRGKQVCRARAEHMSAFEDFKDAVPEGKATPEDKRVLTNAEIGDLLIKAEGLASWYKDLKDYAAEQIEKGNSIKGWKLVEGKGGARQFAIGIDEALKRLEKAGYEEAILYDRKPKSLAQLEKITGKAEFARIFEKDIVKPPGAPTLVVESDKRPALNTAAADFKDVNNEK